MTVIAPENVKLIAFYLPQFHPVPENDAWWGKGFTEWRNVAKARPKFEGHYQPHLPADLGFYDLRVPEVREAQADMARQYGVHGFCYYHYWFNGRRILERPFNDTLKSGKPDFPFCLCWANENWSRRWDGLDHEILLQQDYNDDDDRNHILSLLPAFEDERYIRVNGKPLFLVYRTELLPNPAQTAEIWRNEARRHGLGEIYLARVERFTPFINPQEIGFDAAVEFAPYTPGLAPIRYERFGLDSLKQPKATRLAYNQNFIHEYKSLAQNYLAANDSADYRRFRCVAPSWDNSARRATDANILHNSDPDAYEQWLKHAILKTYNNPIGERIVFINAWNEWAEGCHLEPDAKYGHQFLEATRNALKSALPANIR